MKIALSRLPYRRSEILIAVFLMSGLIGLLWLTRRGDYGARVSIAAIEIFLPLLMGIIAAGLLADDPALELLLTAPRPTRYILVDRILVVLGLGVIFGIAVQLLTKTWGIFLPHEGISQAFIWISPLVFYTGASSAVSLVRGHMLDGVILCLVISGIALLSGQIIAASCQGSTLIAGCWLAVLNPLMTSSLPYDPLWPVNRVLWFVLGVLLVGASLLLAGHGERFFRDTPVE
jgi:hypothetical protein